MKHNLKVKLLFSLAKLLPRHWQANICHWKTIHIWETLLFHYSVKLFLLLVWQMPKSWPFNYSWTKFICLRHKSFPIHLPDWRQKCFSFINKNSPSSVVAAISHRWFVYCTMYLMLTCTVYSHRSPDLFTLWLALIPACSFLGMCSCSLSLLPHPTKQCHLFWQFQSFSLQIF